MSSGGAGFQKPDIHFENVQVRRMPGFTRGGFDVEGLCPGVNIVYGPNASGKTTFSRAIQTLLRPSDAPPEERRSLWAAFALRGRRHTIDYDYGKLKLQQDGSDIKMGALAPADVQGRYVLALHDLIRSEDGRDLAEEILRELAGGYDVAQAKEELGFRDRPRGRGSATRELEAAAKHRREVRRRQDELLKRQGELGQLREQRKNAQAARNRLDWLGKAERYLNAKDRCHEAEHSRAAFPEGVGKLAGNELEQLEKLRKALADAQQRRRQEESDLTKAKQGLRECRLPEEGVAPELVGTLRQKCQQLQSVGAEIRRAEQERDRAAAEMDQARRNVGPAVGPEHAQELDLDVVQELAGLARRAEKLRGDAAAAEALRAWLGPDEQVTPESRSTLIEGAGLLQSWLGAEAAASPPLKAKPWWIAAAAVAAVSVVLGLLAHWSWLFLLLAAVGLLVWTFMAGRQLDPRAESRRQFESLGLGTPAEWTIGQVRLLMHQLQERLAEATLQEQRAAKWGNLSHRQEECARQQEQLNVEKFDWIQRLGIALDCNQTDETWLYLLAANLNRFQKAQKDHAGAQAVLKRVREQHRKLLEEINESLCQFDWPPAKDAEQAGSHIEDLDQRQQTHRATRQEIDNASGSLKKAGEEIGAAEAAQTRLFERVGLTLEDEPTLRQWADMLPRYRQADETFRLAQHELKLARQAVAEKPELMSMTGEAIAEDQARCREQDERLESINRDIGAIEEAIRTAKRSSDLEAALAREIECAEALRQHRQQDYDAVVGNVLAGWLGRQERELERPGILGRARELFVKFTHGRYRLNIERGDPPDFRAIATDQEVGLTLDELSSGTRLQLLLAARIASVERQERDIRLPLVFDETLGNSDERRAREIIDAAIEICREGRQVFYLTAQHDEVGKWESILKHHQEVPWRLVDLAEVRKFSETERVPPMDYEAPKAVDIPTPEGSDWWEYGKRLGVPPFDPHRELGGAHLWYLIDDLPALYRLLRNGINRWGQLQTLAKYGRDESVSTDSHTYARARAAARLLDVASRLWRIGRGVAVDREVLIDSGAVSDVFIDSVSELAAELQGDAKNLMEKLEQGRVERFRTKNSKKLRRYLIDKRYLDERDALGAEQIREQIQPRIFSDVEQGLLTQQRVEQLIQVVLATTPEGTCPP